MKLTKRIFTLLLAIMLFVSATSISVFAKGDIVQGIGWVTATSLRLRKDPSTHAQILDNAENGEVVVIISKQGDWYKVNYNLQVGYMHSDYVNVLTKENAELGYGTINGSQVNLRTGPSTRYSVRAVSNKGDKAYIIGLNEGWYKVIYGSSICYIRSDYVDLTEIPYENTDSAKSPKFFRDGKSTGTLPSAAALNGTTANTKPNTDNNAGNNSNNTNSAAPNTGNETTSVTGQQILNKAKQYLGVPYVWAGASPSGFDCSGLVYYVLKTLGISAYRTPADQYKMGTYVAKEDLQPGDIVFFQGTYKSGISHVGIYAGNGQFIHSPHTGAVVSFADLYSNYYVEHYYGARRIG